MKASESGDKTLGVAIDEVVSALEPLKPDGRLIAVRAGCQHLGIELTGTEVATPRAEQRTDVPPGPVHGARPQHGAIDIRSLKDEKQPSSAVEMACLVAYYLQELAPTKSAIVTNNDIETYFKQAGFRLPKIIAQVLVDAKKGGYVDSVERGRYKLNPVGYNLVAHALPRRSNSAHK